MGGAITSSQMAVDEDKNRLTTATLITRDIQNNAEASASSSGMSLSTDMFTQGKYGVAKGIIGNALDNADASKSNNGQTRAVVSQGVVEITDEARQTTLTGKTSAETVASLNRDEAAAHVATAPIDHEVLQKQVEAERTIKNETFKQVTAVTTDLVYKQQTADKKIILQECDASNENCSQRPINADEVKVIDGKVYIFNHGIGNDERGALTSAYEKNTAEANQQGVYVIINPYTGNLVAEVLTAAWDKLNEITNAAFPISSAAEANIDIRNEVKRQGGVVMEVDHSRGALTGSIATSEQVKQGESNAAIGLVTFYGAAANAQRMADLVNTATSGTGTMQQATHKDDLVGVLIGGNAPTGGLNASVLDAHTSYTGSLPPEKLANGDKNNLRDKINSTWGWGQYSNPVVVFPLK